MRKWLAGVTSIVVASGLLSLGSAASAKPIVMPTVVKEYQDQRAALARAQHDGITPPALPCPENGLLYPPPVPIPAGVPYLLGNCGVAQPVATGTPWAGNMAYFGGHVQLHPKEYLIYWGWGEPGAFPGATCSPESFSEGTITASLGCDPDGAGKYMADFVHQMGGSDWAKVSTQYYQTNSDGTNQYLSNDKNVLAGIWADDTNDISSLAKTNSSNPAGPTNTYTQLAQEAARAAAHFGVTGDALADANFVVIQPPAYSDPNALNSGYCAFHDYTLAGVPGNFYYDQTYVQQGVSYTNMPYALAINSGGANLCGENSINSGAAGKLDGFSIVLGHELEETITDPGAESNVGSGANVAMHGGWYDTTDPNENGDKCAWVGIDPLTGQGPPFPIPGAVGTMTGNAGTVYPVQSLWSNADNAGTGYCAGAGTDSPVPAASWGTNASDGTPGNTAPPSIGGTPAAAATLTASPGGWSGSPTTYAYQWESCDPSGQSCTDIPGANAETYTPAAGDVGNTLAVAVYAANANGSGLWATSAPSTAVLATLPSSPSGTLPATGPAGSTSPPPTYNATVNRPTHKPVKKKAKPKKKRHTVSRHKTTKRSKTSHHAVKRSARHR